MKAHLKHGMTRCVDASISALVGARTYHLASFFSVTSVVYGAVDVHHLGIVGDDCREIGSSAYCDSNVEILCPSYCLESNPCQ